MSGPQISDHALLRFLERSSGLDFEGVRAALSTALERAHKAARALGDHDYLVKIGGRTFVVRGDMVTTVLDTGRPSDEAHAIQPRKP